MDQAMEAPPSAPCWSSIVQKQAPQKPEHPIANRVFENYKSKQGIAVAVVDANAIIQGGDQLVNMADRIVSVSEVLSEVRDPLSRLRLQAVPVTIDIMEPDPDALKKVVNFARATGDLQTLSDVDLKLIALAYTLESQCHGTKHLRDNPPPLHVVNVKRLPEKEMPGWGNNVPNLAEWEALENTAETDLNSESRILALKGLNLDAIPSSDHTGTQSNLSKDGNRSQAEHHGDPNVVSGRHRRFMPKKKEINLEEKKMVASGIDASLGEDEYSVDDWKPAVSRSTHRRYLRRKARRELSEASEKLHHTDDELDDYNKSVDTCMQGSCQAPQPSNELGGKDANVGVNGCEEHTCLESDPSIYLQENEMGEFRGGGKDQDSVFAEASLSEITVDEHDEVETLTTDLDNLEILSHADESLDTSVVDDGSSVQSWTLQSLSDSTVACVTSDFAMQNVILQMGLRLVAPGGMQIRQLHRWILKCHACNKVTAEVGRIFCPKCGNGGTLRKVSATVGENGIILAARKPRVTLRGTKFSLPLPQGGRDAITKNPILREDQLPHKVLYPKNKKKPNKQDLDMFSADDIFSLSADKRDPLKPPIRNAMALFGGRRNPNDNHFSRNKH
ncbi:RNA-binding NOB1-like protein [Aristolochia californica]|uniref:RNA-binding NOB1-like protein n=1 Tax=Aristolochia californica TaxID=171875 RepID=UPI0035DA29C5